MKILAIVPAKDNSKRVIGKNWRLFSDGSSLVSRTLLRIQESHLITDSCLLLGESLKEVPFFSKKHKLNFVLKRPKWLCTDKATEYDFVHFALQQLKIKHNYTPDLIVILYPTTPFKRARTIDACILKFIENQTKYESLKTVVPNATPVFKLWKLKEQEDTLLNYEFMKDENLKKANPMCASQLQKNIFEQVPYCYIFPPELVINFKTTVGNCVLPYILEKSEESFDVNTEFDWKIANMLISNYEL